MPEEHVAYAMQNAEALNSLLWFNNPATLKHWTQPVLEILVITGALLGLAHALGHARKNGQLANLYTWIACVFYGIFIEIITYSTVDNFWHGEFTVMLYHNRLPLYIMLLYPALIYTTLITVQALKLNELRCGRIIEALSAGFFIQMIYAPFDNIGPRFHWWIWDMPNETLWPFWSSVPSTSYFWILSTAISMCLIARWLLWELGPKKNFGHGKMLLLAIGVGLLANVLMVVLMLPSSILAQGFQLYFQSASLIVLCMLTAAWVYFLAPKTYPSKPEPLVMAFPILWCSWHLILYATTFDDLLSTRGDGLTMDGMPMGNFIIAGITLALSIHLYIFTWVKNKQTR
jgi:hypothetical protein